MNRQQRIAEAETKVIGLKLVLDPLQRQLDDAETELKRAKASYDIGERVRVVETCKRGCCVELSYTGKIVGAHDWRYDIVADDYKQTRYTDVSPFDMERL